jgi:hypothetical protein
MNNQFTIKMLSIKYNLSKNIIKKRLFYHGIKLIPHCDRIRGKLLSDYQKIHKEFENEHK